MTQDDTHYTISDAPEPPEPDEPTTPTEAASGTTVEVVEESASTDEPAGPAPKEAWRDVLTQIDALGDSMTRWAKAAVNDPENRRHASEIKARLDNVGDRIASSFDDATKTDIGRSVHHAAEQTGKAVVDAGGKVAAEAAPVVASVLSGFAGMLGKAAERVGTSADKRTTGASPVEPDTAPAEAPEPTAETPAQPDSADEPDAPA